MSSGLQCNDPYFPAIGKGIQLMEGRGLGEHYDKANIWLHKSVIVETTIPGGGRGNRAAAHRDGSEQSDRD